MIHDFQVRLPLPFHTRLKVADKTLGQSVPLHATGPVPQHLQVRDVHVALRLKIHLYPCACVFCVAPLIAAAKARSGELSKGSRSQRRGAGTAAATTIIPAKICKPHWIDSIFVLYRFTLSSLAVGAH